MNTLVEIKEKESKKDAEEKNPIIKPNPADVLCQRGGKGSKGHDHIGNRRYRSLVLIHKEYYTLCDKREKRQIAMDIINTIKTSEPRGRFITYVKESNRWEEVNDAKAVVKTCQALREKYCNQSWKDKSVDTSEKHSQVCAQLTGEDYNNELRDKSIAASLKAKKESKLSARSNMFDVTNNEVLQKQLLKSPVIDIELLMRSASGGNSSEFKSQQENMVNNADGLNNISLNFIKNGINNSHLFANPIMALNKTVSSISPQPAGANSSKSGGSTVNVNEVFKSLSQGEGKSNVGTERIKLPQLRLPEIDGDRLLKGMTTELSSEDGNLTIETNSKKRKSTELQDIAHSAMEHDKIAISTSPQPVDVTSDKIYSHDHSSFKNEQTREASNMIDAEQRLKKKKELKEKVDQSVKQFLSLCSRPEDILSDINVGGRTNDSNLIANCASRSTHPQLPPHFDLSNYERPVDLPPLPDETPSNSTFGAAVVENQKSTELKHNALADGKVSPGIKDNNSNGSYLSAQITEHEKPPSQYKKIKKSPLVSCGLNMNVSVYINDNQTLMMGYPVAKIYNKETNEIVDESMTDLINSLCTSIKRKRRISNKMKEKLMEDLKHEEYELTINTVEGYRVEINDPLSLQNSIRMLIDNNESIYMNFEVIAEDQERAIMDVTQAINYEHNMSSNLQMNLQPQNGLSYPNTENIALLNPLPNSNFTELLNRRGLINYENTTIISPQPDDVISSKENSGALTESLEFESSGHHALSNNQEKNQITTNMMCTPGFNPAQFLLNGNPSFQPTELKDENSAKSNKEVHSTDSLQPNIEDTEEKVNHLQLLAHAIKKQEVNTDSQQKCEVMHAIDNGVFDSTSSIQKGKPLIPKIEGTEFDDKLNVIPTKLNRSQLHVNSVRKENKISMDISPTGGDVISSVDCSGTMKENTELKSIKNHDQIRNVVENQVFNSPAQLPVEYEKKSIEDKLNITNFPAQLRIILDEDQHPSVLSWQKDGISFIIYDQVVFQEKVLPLYFKTTKWKSFQKQLNIYGFKEVEKQQRKSKREHIYMHKFFIRSDPKLVNRIKRVKVWKRYK